MRILFFPTEVRAVQSEDGTCLLFGDDTAAKLELCFDARNHHVVRYLRGELVVLERALGLEPRS